MQRDAPGELRSMQGRGQETRAQRGSILGRGRETVGRPAPNTVPLNREGGLRLGRVYVELPEILRRRVRDFAPLWAT
jgi:hypothetical protein